MRYLLTLVVLVLSRTAWGQLDSVDVWISRINNNQLHGTCHYVWTLELKEEAKDVFNLIKSGKSATDKLIENLTDQRKGIICHYILSTVMNDTLTIETLAMDESKVRYRVNNLEFEEMYGRLRASKADLDNIKTYWINQKRAMRN